MKQMMAFFCALVLMLTAAQAEEEGFTVGYAVKSIPIDGSDHLNYNVAGYRNHVYPTDILDNQQVKALVLDDNSGAGPVVLVSIDCVGLSSAEVGRIRAALSDFAQETGCRGIHITATHDHAGADTLGLWGREGEDGKNGPFMEFLREQTVRCVLEAYEARTAGQLYFGWADTAQAGIQEDTRAPYVFDSKIYSFRFVPDDAEKQTVHLINYASHAESLDTDNTMISADFPAYVAKKLAEQEDSAMIWFPGAVGGLIRTRFVEADRVENCRATGERIAGEILSIDNEVRLTPEIRLLTEEFSVPCDNPLFIALRFLGVMDHKAHSKGGRVWLDTEMTWLSIGGKQILMLPGEIFPELVYGNDTDFQGNFPEKAMPDLCSLFGEDLLIFGLTDDEIGYIVPPNDFMVAETKPYVNKIVDAYGENHYEETNSAGPETAQRLYEAAARLRQSVEKMNPTPAEPIGQGK